MQQTKHPARPARKRRALSLLLALAMLLGLVPGLPAAAPASAHWADPYLSQLVEWGFIRADQANQPDQALTRADFMGIVNRAYGYDVTGPTPFTDVNEYDWYYDDVGIAYTARYINGTSPTTASPQATLDRETATTILGRNMMLQESAGEILDFTDARAISNWSRGTIKSSMEHYLVTGYDDGTFRPQKAVSWGEMAALISRTVGTPLQEAGEYSLGGVFGNVTITADGVTLRDTVISGDLYITGGVGLGGIKLENVTVLGRIIASGTGQSEDGEASILLRNVIADELLVDNLQDNYVSVRADGITEIGATTVRTSAYIEDNTPDGLGLKTISLEGETYPEGEEPDGWSPVQLDLAGRIETVVNRTPGSQVRAAEGTVAKLTVDEAAVGSTVIIDRGAEVKELNLDVGINVTGEGDVEKLVVNAPGAIVSMLPDQIEIRPGITAVINGQVMDSTTAKEASLDPMILSGYPVARDVAPTSISAVFSTNKRGTIHWAVSAIADGSVGEEDLIRPPAYGSIAVQRGTLTSPRGDEEVTAAVTGLQPDGSYYLSAVLVDDRGVRSPTKVISFTTPDNTVPAFNQGYPYMSKTSRTNSQAVVSANKACVLYYALFAEGATPPTVNDLKTGSVAGSYGYGIQTLEKNTEFAIQVNDRTLREQENYVVYFWLTDANGANSSAVIPLTFTTDDETPPYFLQGYPNVSGIQANAVNLTFRISENGTAFWVVVPEGEAYPKPESGQTGTAPLDSEYAKLQVAAGSNALASGSVTVNGNTDGRFNVTGLEPGKAYDLYYLCQDTAGNFSITVEHMTIRTTDEKGPQVLGQYFDSFVGDDNTKNPKSDTAVELVFSENVCSSGDIQTDFRTLYEAINTAADREQAIANFAKALQDSITLYKRNTDGAFIAQPSYQDNPDGNWVIDYSLAEISLNTVTGQLTVRFPDEALNLESGATYHFVVSKLTDNAAPRKNPLENADGQVVSEVVLPDFEVAFASVILAKDPGLDSNEDAPQRRTTAGQKLWETDSTGNRTPYYVNPDTSLYFRMTPSSTEAINEWTAYDILLWNEETVGYQLYYRILDESKNVVTQQYCGTNGVDPLITPEEKVQNDSDKGIDANGWIYLGDTVCETRTGSWQARSVNRHINGCGPNQFPRLTTLDTGLTYEFYIALTKVGTEEDPTAWTGKVNFRAQVVAGTSSNLHQLAGNVRQNWDEMNGSLTDGMVAISNMDHPDRWLEWYVDIHDTKIPVFVSNTPQFVAPANDADNPPDQSITMQLALDPSDTYIYYVIGKAYGEGGTPEIITTVKAGSQYADPNGVADSKGNVTIDVDKVPLGGTAAGGLPLFEVAEPLADNIYDPESWTGLTSDIYGEISYSGTRILPFTVGPGIDQKLEPDTTYLAYFVLKGRYSDKSQVYVYKFTTEGTAKPRISPNDTPLTEAGAQDGDVDVRTHVASHGYYRTVTETAALHSIGILMEPFSKYVYTAEELKAVTGGASAGKEVPPCYTDDDYTVLQALRDAYSQNNADVKPYSNSHYVFPSTKSGYTVFDFYANENARIAVYNIIRSLPTDVSRGVTGPMSIDPPEGSRTEDWSKFHVKTQLAENDEDRYFLLTYAVNDNSTLPEDDEYKEASFNAYRFGRGELLPPEVDYVELTLENDTGGKYKGEIFVQWKKSTYLRNEYGDAQDITSGNLLESLFGHQFSPFTGSEMWVQGTPDSTFFRIGFSGVESGSANFASRYFANADNQSATKALTFTLVKNNNQVQMIAKWGGVTVGESNIIGSGSAIQDYGLTFQGEGLKYSGATGHYILELKGNTSKDITGIVTGGGKAAFVSVKPVKENSRLAIPTAPGNMSPADNFSLSFKGKAIGTNETFEVSVIVNTDDGGVVTLTGYIDVSVTGDVKIESITPTNDTSTITPNSSGTEYDWVRNDNGTKVANITLVAATGGLLIDDSLVVSADSTADTSLEVRTPTIANGKITVPISYLSSAGGSAVVTIKIGALTKEITIYLKGANDSGTTAIATIKNPYS